MVRSGMRLGLGTGSTAGHFLRALAARLAAGDLEDVIGVPTSVRTEREAARLGIPLGTLSALVPLDLTVDGADEIDPALNLIKGLGGALLREKMVAQASRRVVAIVDETKEVARLGARAPVPVEVVPFAFESHLEWMTATLGCTPRLRMDPAGAEDGPRPFCTDNRNHMIDCFFEGGIPDPAALAEALRSRAGVVESGLFLGVATGALVAGQGGVRRR